MKQHAAYWLKMCKFQLEKEITYEAPEINKNCIKIKESICEIKIH